MTWQGTHSDLGPLYRSSDGFDLAGRWSRLPDAAPEADPERVEVVARALLRRWGVVFRRLLDRESGLPPWRTLLRIYRRLEARGELRGGRFVAGYSGEQYALPEAVGRLRAVRRAERDGALVAVSAADPVNLVGILTPGARLPSVVGNRVVWRDGVLVAVREGRQVRWLTELPADGRWPVESLLARRPGVAGVGVGVRG